MLEFIPVRFVWAHVKAKKVRNSRKRSNPDRHLRNTGSFIFKIKLNFTQDQRCLNTCGGPRLMLYWV